MNKKNKKKNALNINGNEFTCLLIIINIIYIT